MQALVLPAINDQRFLAPAFAFQIIACPVFHVPQLVEYPANRGMGISVERPSFFQDLDVKFTSLIDQPQADVCPGQVILGIDHIRVAGLKQPLLDL